MSTGGKILFLGHRPEVSQQPIVRLQVEGYEVDEVHTREEAETALKEETYDLLILDAELPDSDGWAVLQNLVAHPEFGETKVLVFMAPKGETEKLSLVKVNAELRRPFTMADLVTAVDGVLAEAD